MTATGLFLISVLLFSRRTKAARVDGLAAEDLGGNVRAGELVSAEAQQKPAPLVHLLGDWRILAQNFHGLRTVEQWHPRKSGRQQPQIRIEWACCPPCPLRQQLQRKSSAPQVLRHEVYQLRQRRLACAVLISEVTPPRQVDERR